MSDEFPKKLKAMLSPDWLSKVDSMSQDEMNEDVVKCQQTMALTEQDMADDEKLTAAKELAKDLSFSYKEVLKMEKVKVKYLLHVMKSRGYF